MVGNSRLEFCGSPDHVPDVRIADCRLCCVSFIRRVAAPVSTLVCIFKPPPPVGAGGGYMFSGRPSVLLSVRASVIHVVVLCFHDISSI